MSFEGKYEKGECEREKKDLKVTGIEFEYKEKLPAMCT
jgi:hypothetical protein